MGTLKTATTATQISEILAYMQTGKGLTKAEAVKLFGTLHLNGRVWDIRQKGIEVWYVWEHGTNRHERRVDFKRYYLAEFKPHNAELENTKPKVNKAQRRYEAATKFLYTDPDFWKSTDIDPLKLEKSLKIAAGLNP